jgi:hypothetical protein
MTMTFTTEHMSEKELYAYYKRRAPVDDLVFLRRNASPVLAAEIDALLGDPKRKVTAADAVRARGVRRVELLAAEVASGEPAIGSERWHAAQNGEVDAATARAAALEETLRLMAGGAVAA